MDHRPQLMDDINDSKVLLEDLGMKELKSLVTGTTLDYNPPEPFFTRVWHELHRRNEKAQKTQDDVNRMHEAFKNRKTKINKDFY
jgi:uncharacterized protein YaaN involved in tellurite resistance